MRGLVCVGSIVALAAVYIPTSSVAVNYAFEFNPLITYQSVGSEVLEVNFFPKIRSYFPSGDDLFVDIERHVPPGWFAQFCQQSTGICYIDDAVIELRDASYDTLRVDIFAVPGEVDTAWVDIRVSRDSDPTTYEEAIFAIGHGFTLPNASYTFRCNTYFQQTDPYGTVEFPARVQSNNAFNDVLLVEMQPQIPDGWITQVCQTSTGICYIYDPLNPDSWQFKAPLGAYVADTLRVDFFCFDPDPGIGNHRVKTRSLSNPAIWKALPFRVRAGEVAASVIEVSAAGFDVQVAPNPLRDAADFRLRLDRPSLVEVTILDINGRVVVAQSEGPLQAGLHSVHWNGRDDRGHPVPSGTYFYQVAVTGARAQGKLTIER